MNDPLCAYCEKPGKLARDHVVPRSRGGPDNATNIVAACQSCNSSKGDNLPSEWLGERCPPAVKAIEDRIHAKLEKSFKYRKPANGAPVAKTNLYAFHVSKMRSVDSVDFIGEVIHEIGGIIRLEATDGLLLACGIWSLSGSIYDLAANECRLFRDAEACVEAADKINAVYFATPEFQSKLYA